jgi:PAS domain S-box-containing protein
MTNHLSIRHRIYLAFGLLGLIFLVAVVINERLASSFAKTTHDNTLRIQTMMANGQQLQELNILAKWRLENIQTLQTNEETLDLIDTFKQLEDTAIEMLAYLEAWRLEEVTGSYKDLHLQIYLKQVLQSATIAINTIETKQQLIINNQGLQTSYETVFYRSYHQLQYQLSLLELNTQPDRDAIQFQLAKSYLVLHDFLSNPDIVEVEDVENAFSEVVKVAQKSVPDYLPQFLEIKKFATFRAQTHSERIKILEGIQANLLSRVRENIEGLEIISKTLLEYSETIENENRSILKNLKIISIVSFILALSVAAFVFFTTIKSILSKLNRLTNALLNIASDELNISIPFLSDQDELHNVAEAIRRLRDQALEQKVLKKELEQMALVASKTNNAVIITDGNAQIRWVNQAFLDISGYSLNDVLGQKPAELLHGPETDPDTIEYIANTVNAGEGCRVEIANYGKDNQPYWVTMDIQPVLSEDNETTEYIAVQSDISEMKRTQEALHEAVAKAETLTVKAELANIAKSEFLANMSHEIRTPMNGILGMLKLLMKQPLPEESARHAQLALNSAESLLVIINDILDFSKIEAGKLNVERIPFNLVRLIEEFQQSMLLNLREKSLSHSLDLSKLKHIQVLGDPHRIRQILVNLYSNAIKFTESGEIGLTVKSKDQNEVIFSITDSGIGISQDNQAHLFDKFTQADSSTTRMFGGTGLGLSICKQLCELMGGKIWLESTLNKGSTFSFSLPLAKTQQEQTSLNSSNQTELNTSTSEAIPVLLVEDNLINQEVAKDLLSDLGFVVEIANNGQEALDHLSKEQSHQMILMDCQMPILDGYETTKAIRSGKVGSRYQSIPIIAMTANAMSGDREKCLASGMDDYITKPLDHSVVQAVLSEWQNKSSTN